MSHEEGSAHSKLDLNFELDSLDVVNNIDEEDDVQTAWM